MWSMRRGAMCTNGEGGGDSSSWGTFAPRSTSPGRQLVLPHRFRSIQLTLCAWGCGESSSTRLPSTRRAREPSSTKSCSSLIVKVTTRATSCKLLQLPARRTQITSGSVPFLVLQLPENAHLTVNLPALWFPKTFLNFHPKISENAQY